MTRLSSLLATRRHEKGKEPYNTGYYDRIKTFTEEYKKRHDKPSSNYLRSLLTPDDISSLFYEGKVIVQHYLVPKTLYFFAMDNSVRKTCITIMLSTWFDRFILFSICLNALFLAADNPLNNDNQRVFNVAEIVFNVIFTIEFIIKLVSQGALDSLCGYFRDSWNRLDFTLLIAGWLPQIFVAVGLNSISNFSFVRAIRILKVLKTVKSIPDLKRLVQAILDAIPRLISVGYVLAFIFLLFGILGTQLYAGLLRNRCFPENLDVGSSYVASDDLCSPSSFPGTASCPIDTPICSVYFPGTKQANRNANPYQNFDNTPLSFLNILVIISLEGWSAIMFDILETIGLPAVAYFVILIMLGSFFVINLVIAVIYQSYINTIEELKLQDAHNQAKLKMIYRLQRAGSVHSFQSMGSMEDHRVEGMDEQYRPPLINSMMQYSFFPRAITSFVSTNDYFITLEKFCRVVVGSATFRVGLVIVILFNICILAVEADGVEGNGAKFAFIANVVCTAIFTLELFVQVIALNIPTFFSSNFNILDSFIVAVSLIELSYGNSSASLSAFRTLRVLRTFKLLKRWESLQHLIMAVFKSGPGLGYFCLILFLYLFICSLMGMSLFAGKLDSNDDVYGTRANFDSLYSSFVTTFQLVTGENWDVILYRTMNYSPAMGVLFCVFVYVCGCLVLLNILLAILLENFSEKKDGAESYYDKLEATDYSILSTFKQYFHNFVGVIKERLRHGFCCCSAKSKMKEEEIQMKSSPRKRRTSFVFTRNASEKLIAQQSGKWDGWSAISTSNHRGIMFMQNANDFFSDIMKHLPLGSYIRETKSTMREMFSECFLGCELIDLLLDQNVARSADEATRMGQELLYTRKILPLLISSENNISDQSRGSNVSMRQSSINKQDNVLNVQFKDDNSLYRINVQESQITEWLLESGTSEKKIKELLAIEKKHEIEDMLSGASFGIFSSDNKIRVRCANIVSHWYFEALVMFMILISSICLAIDEPTVDAASTFGKTLHAFDIAFTAFFSIEMLVKMISSGVYFSQRAYLKNGWNVLDFLIVMISIISLSLSSFDLSFLKSFRAIRALRPLRMVSRLNGLKAVVNACLLVIQPLVNFSMVVSVFIFTFAILGSSLFQGKLSYCHATAIEPALNATVDNEEFRYLFDAVDCVGTVVNTNGIEVLLNWGPVNSNFDSFGSSFLTLLELASMENWPEIMYPALDMPSRPSLHPVLNNSKFYGLFFIAFIIVGSFFISNLFVGIIVHKFNVARNDEKRSVFLTEDQQIWFDNLMTAMTTSPSKLNPAPSHSELYGLKRRVYFLTSNDGFKLVMDVIIICNVLVMSLVHFDQTKSYTKSIRILDIFFAVVFAIEISLRYFATSPRKFISLFWNIFDTIIVIGALVDVIFEKIAFNITILRVLRVGRVLRLMKNSKNIVLVINTLYFSLPSLLNVGALLFLAFFIFAVVGMNLFGDSIPDGEFFNRYQNFSGFGSTMLLLFSCLTGENWNTGMYILKNQGYAESVPYFVLFLLVNRYMMLNLFIAVILENFENALKNDVNQIHQHHLLSFSISWSKICNELGGEDPDRLPCFVLVKLLHDLPHPLGFKDNPDSYQVDMLSYRTFLLRFVRSLDLKEDSKGKIHFLDTLSALVRRHQKQCGMLTKKMDPNVMDPKTRHKILFEMRKNCKKSTLRGIESSMKSESFTEIDLINELNSAQFIQKNWRLIRACRKFSAVLDLLKRTSEEQVHKTHDMRRSRILTTFVGGLLKLNQTRTGSSTSSLENTESEHVQVFRGRVTMTSAFLSMWKRASGRVLPAPKHPDPVDTRQCKTSTKVVPSEAIAIATRDVKAASSNEIDEERDNSLNCASAMSKDCPNEEYYMENRDVKGVCDDRTSLKRTSKQHSKTPAFVTGNDSSSPEKSNESGAQKTMSCPSEHHMEISARSELMTQSSSKNVMEGRYKRILLRLQNLTEDKKIIEEQLFQLKMDEVSQKLFIRVSKQDIKAKKNRPAKGSKELQPLMEEYLKYKRIVRRKRLLSQKLVDIKSSIAELELCRETCD